MTQISPKLFSRDIQSELHPENTFYTKGFKDIAAGDKSSVEVPQAGITDSAATGEPDLPIAITRREDSTKEYSLLQVYAPPQLVTREEEIVLNYNKQKDLASAMADIINTKCADISAHAYAPTGADNILLSTGTARPGTLVGGTGTRKGLAKSDLISARNLAMRMNVRDLQNWLLVVTPDQYFDLLKITDFVDYEKTGVESKLIKGIIRRVLGFDIMVRWNDELGSIGAHYAPGAKTLKDNGTVATTDSAAALLFHPRYVRYAEAHAKTIINREPAGYLGATIIESLVRFGAAKSRNDEKGVIAIVESSTS